METAATAARRPPPRLKECADCGIPITISYGAAVGMMGLICYPCAARRARRDGVAGYPHQKVKCAGCGNPLAHIHTPATPPAAGCSRHCRHNTEPFCSPVCAAAATAAPQVAPVKPPVCDCRLGKCSVDAGDDAPPGRACARHSGIYSA